MSEKGCVSSSVVKSAIAEPKLESKTIQQITN